MKIYSTFLYIGLSMVATQPVLSQAQTSFPAWLQPSWLKTKMTDDPVKNSDRYDTTQANVLTNNGTSNLQTNPQSNQQSQQTNSQTLQPRTVTLAPVETAVPKMNEKYLSAEELKELRRQLRQQR